MNASLIEFGDWCRGLAPAFFLAANTGMRRGEVLGLRWDDVDLDAARISVRHAVLNVAYELVVADVKTRTSRRTIDLDPRTVAVMRAWRKAQLEERLALGHRPDDAGIVFAALDAGRLTRTYSARPSTVTSLSRPCRGSGCTTSAIPTPRSC